MPDFSQLDLRGTVIDERFEIIEPIGAGASGCVYKANQIGLDRIVAVKLLTNAIEDADSRQRFIRESEILSGLTHPNIARFLAFGFWQARFPFFAMEYLTFPTLQKLLTQRDKLPWQQVRLIGIEVAKALAAAHDVGIVHRDLSPRNIMVDLNSREPKVKVIDFGLATAPKQMEQNLTQTGYLIGTPHYMSPEMCLGQKVDVRSDIYSLSCVMYQCLTGRLPVDADTVYGIAYKHAHEVPANLTDFVALPVELEAVIMKGLQKDREKRFESAGAFMEALSTVDDQSVPKARRQNRMNTRMFSAIAGGTLLVAAAAVLVVTQMKPAAPTADPVTLSVSPGAFHRLLEAHVGFKDLSDGEFLQLYREYYQRNKSRLEADPAIYGQILFRVAPCAAGQDRMELHILADRILEQAQKTAQKPKEKECADWHRAMNLRNKLLFQGDGADLNESMACIDALEEYKQDREACRLRAIVARRLAMTDQPQRAYGLLMAVLVDRSFDVVDPNACDALTLLLMHKVPLPVPERVKLESSMLAYLGDTVQSSYLARDPGCRRAVDSCVQAIIGDTQSRGDADLLDGALAMKRSLADISSISE